MVDLDAPETYPAPGLQFRQCQVDHLPEDMKICGSEKDFYALNQKYVEIIQFNYPTR